VYSVSFSPSAGRIASGSLAGKLYVWDVDTGKVSASYTGKGDIFEVGFDATERRVAACFSSSIVSIVDVGDQP
jgi:transducin (beta)-like 1